MGFPNIPPVTGDVYSLLPPNVSNPGLQGVALAWTHFKNWNGHDYNEAVFALASSIADNPPWQAF